MERLKLVLVDDEPILLKGLINTYDWDSMGFEVVGTAQNGEQAIDVIKEVKPHVVLTDIRMKQISGLDVIESISKEGLDCLFIVLSAYRDFEYAQAACDLGAFAYLLKPIEDDKLQETMISAYKSVMDKIKSSEKYANWENLVMKDSASFLQVIIQKYLKNQITYEKMEDVFKTLSQQIDNEDRFISLNVNIDLAYKITNEVGYEASRFALIQFLQEAIGKKYDNWHFEEENGSYIFIIRTKDNATVREIRDLLEEAKENQKSPIVAAISKPYKNLVGISKSYEEACSLFSPISENDDGLFTVMGESIDKLNRNNFAEDEILIINSVRRNDAKGLKEAFVKFIYALPEKEDVQHQLMHKILVQTEMMVEESYGMTEELKKQFKSYYSNMDSLSSAKTVDVCYKILGSAIEERLALSDSPLAQGGKEYIKDALLFIDENLNDEDLSIVSVATHVYLNPVYFGRVFKETMGMSFKKYLLKCRMEKAKEIIRNSSDSISYICDQIGISNPSYFAHLFKEYTGKLPSEYKKDFE
ncbi:MAG: response regulator [Lachnospiraceae bacterium]|nr:response regulator [Lachnospiraceae bacterium]